MVLRSHNLLQDFEEIRHHQGVETVKSLVLLILPVLYRKALVSPVVRPSTNQYRPVSKVSQQNDVSELNI